MGEIEFSSQQEGIIVTLTLENNSHKEITLHAGEVVANIKGQRLMTLRQCDTLYIAPHTTQRCSSLWSVEHDDPATLYAMRRRGVEAYIDRLSFDLTLNAGRVVEIHGIKGKRFVKRFKNTENIFIQ